MTDAEFQARSRKEYLDLKEMLQLVLDNQVKLGNKINSLQTEVATLLHRQQIIGNDQDKMMHKLNSL